MAISQSDAYGLFTKKLIDVYQERIPVPSFIRKMFPSTFSPTKRVSVEVTRGTEKIAVDVVRGSEGNFNTFSKRSEKTYEPPFFREYHNITEMDIYDRVLGAQGTDNTRLFAQLLNDAADRTLQLQNKIERTMELQCVQFLQTGIVTMTNGDNINFNRRQTSIVDLNLAGGGGYFYNDSDVFAQFQTGCKWLRAFGKVTGETFIAVFGEKAHQDFMGNANFLARQDLFNMKLDQIMPPQQGVAGGVFHGTISAGPYRVQIWTYPEVYDNASGVSTDYIDTDKVILTIPKPRWHYAHCLVPQVVMPGTTVAPQKGPWMYGEFIDARKAKHDLDVQTAGVPVPVGIDQVYTMKVR